MGPFFAVRCPMMWGTRHDIAWTFSGKSHRSTAANDSCQWNRTLRMVASERGNFTGVSQPITGVRYGHLTRCASPNIILLLHHFPLLIFRISSSRQPSFTCSSPSYLSCSLFSSLVSVYYFSFFIISLFRVSKFIVVISCSKNTLYDGRVFHYHQSLSFYCSRSFGTCATRSTSHNLFCFINNLRIHVCVVFIQSDGLVEQNVGCCCRRIRSSWYYW